MLFNIWYVHIFEGISELFFRRLQTWENSCDPSQIYKWKNWSLESYNLIQSYWASFEHCSRPQRLQSFAMTLRNLPNDSIWVRNPAFENREGITPLYARTVIRAPPIAPLLYFCPLCPPSSIPCFLYARMLTRPISTMLYNIDTSVYLKQCHTYLIFLAIIIPQYMITFGFLHRCHHFRNNHIKMVIKMMVKMNLNEIRMKIWWAWYGPRLMYKWWSWITRDPLSQVFNIFVRIYRSYTRAVWAEIVFEDETVSIQLQ